MRHATPAGLERISDLLERLRGVNGLVERTPGVFYRRSRAFLHFHEDPAGMFADVRLAGDDFVRFGVTSRSEQASFLRRVRDAVGEDAHLSVGGRSPREQGGSPFSPGLEWVYRHSDRSGRAREGAAP